jgi:hypothetical protein
VAKLGNDLVVANDGASDQLRKECNEQAVVKEIEAHYAANIGVDKKSDLLEGEERNSKR